MKNSSISSESIKDFHSLIKEVPLFKGIGTEEIKEFLKTSESSSRSFAKGEIILSQGDRYDHLCIITRGVSVSEMVDYSGRAVVLGRFTAPFPVAPGFLFLEDPRLPISLRAEIPAEALFIPKSSLQGFLHENRRFLENFLGLLSNRIEYLTGRVSFHSFKTIREKLLMYLESLTADKNEDVLLPMSMEELARHFGVARPSLSQVFIDLREEGVLRKKGRRVRLLL